MRAVGLLLCTFSLVGALRVVAASAADDDAGLARARQTYQTNCATCHGENGKGDGPAAASLNPKPRDFADCESMRKRSDDELLKAISKGGQSIGLPATMPAWSGVLSNQQVHELVKFVRSFCEKS